ncbi:MAG TPA: hypothetical protein PLY26_10355, partial [Ferruginibacter sp.]|nr:hypothetical protein [Ferruginibacter sp.]
IGVAFTSTAMVEISSIPAMNLQKRLSYLIEYPHGCIEQTTSAVFPQLVLNQLMDLDDYKKAQIEKNIRAGINRLQNFSGPMADSVTGPAWRRAMNGAATTPGISSWKRKAMATW